MCSAIVQEVIKYNVDFPFLVFTRFVRKLAMSQLQGPTYVADADISDMYESLTLWTVSFLLPLCAVGVHASVDDAHPQM